MEEINKIRRRAGLAVDWSLETKVAQEKRAALKEEDKSLEDMHHLESKKNAWFYLVQDATAESEPADVISKVNGESFALMFIGSGGGNRGKEAGVAHRENWTLYYEHEKQHAIADANKRLQSAGAQHAITEGSKIVILEAMNPDRAHAGACSAVDAVMDHLEKAIHNETHKHMREMMEKDLHSYRRVYKHCRADEQDKAAKAFRDMDTSAREYISDAEVVKKKTDRRAAAEYLGFELLKEAEKKAKKDYDGDGKVETSSEEHKGVVDKKIKEKKGAAEDGVSESMHYYNEKNYDMSHEDDEDEPINVDSSEQEETVWPKSTAKNDKDESPAQLRTSDTPSEQDQSGGGDLERTIKVPANIKKLLKDEAAQARKEAEKFDHREREAKYFYNDLANAFDDLGKHLDGDKVSFYDIKKAQIFMTSLMGPILHKIPAEVVKFLANGGQTRSLKDHFFDVKDAVKKAQGPQNKLK